MNDLISRAEASARLTLYFKQLADRFDEHGMTAQANCVRSDLDLALDLLSHVQAVQKVAD